MDILEQNERSYRERYGISLREMLMNALPIEVGDYEEYFENIKKQLPSMQSVPADVKLLLILGFGDGSCLHDIIDNLAKDTAVLIYEPDVRQFLYACTRADLPELFEDEKIDIVTGEGDLRVLLRGSVLQKTGVLNISHIFMLSLPGYSEQYPAGKEKLIDAVKEIIMPQVADTVTGVKYSRATYKNQLFALSVLYKSSLLSRLLNGLPWRDMPIILVGAGPSLKKNASALCSVGDRALIIACTRAMTTLERNGAGSHLVAMVDMEEGHDFCTHDADRKYRILFDAQSASDIQAEYEGRGIYFGFPRNDFPLPGLREELSGYPTGGSVITCIFSIFLRAGFKKFILVGEDLAFSESGETHSGEFQEQVKERIFQTEGLNGGTVTTRADWQIFRAFFEQEIKAHPEIEVIDATEGGALIHGSKVMSLEQAVSQLGNTDYPINEVLEQLPIGFSGDREQIKEFYNNVLFQCGNMQYLLQEAILWNERVKKILAEKDPNGQSSYVYGRYDNLYRQIVNDNDADPLKCYAADVLFAYSDKAQYLNNDEQVAERLDLEKTFFEHLLKANDELTAYTQQMMKRIEEFQK